MSQTPLKSLNSQMTSFQSKCVAEQVLRQLQMPIKQFLSVNYVEPLDGYPTTFVEILFLNAQDRQISYSMHMEAWHAAVKRFSPIELTPTTPKTLKEKEQ